MFEIAKPLSYLLRLFRFRRCIQALQARAQSIMTHELRNHTRIFGINDIRLLEIPEPAKGHVAQISDRCRHDRKTPPSLPFLTFFPFIPTHTKDPTIKYKKGEPVPQHWFLSLNPKLLRVAATKIGVGRLGSTKPPVRGNRQNDSEHGRYPPPEHLTAGRAIELGQGSRRHERADHSEECADGEGEVVFDNVRIRSPDQNPKHHHVAVQPHGNAYADEAP